MEFEKIDCENANILVRYRKLREQMLLSAYRVMQDLIDCENANILVRTQRKK